MESIRKWFYKPRRDDHSLLARFFFADETLNVVAAELDSFDGRKDPERCSTLVNQLRLAQDRVLNITSEIMDQLLGEERVARGFRVKFPEDVLQDNLAGQLWFGAECLAAGSSIMNREEESSAMRPLAKALTRSLETVRGLLRDRCLRPHATLHDDMLIESLKIFDRLFAEFELCYVSAMVSVKTPHEFESQQLICVLFSETLNRALKSGLLSQEQVDDYDPALMFAIPRLAIVTGLLVFSHGPLSIDKPTDLMSEMFRPFRRLLYKIRELLWTLDRAELSTLERLLCTNEDISTISLEVPKKNKDGEDDVCAPVGGEYAEKVLSLHPHALAHTTRQNVKPSPQSERTDLQPSNLPEEFRRLEMIEEDGTPISPVESDLKTFQETSQEQPRSRRTSRNDSSDLSSLRNLSSSALMMFDPLVINAATNETSSNVILVPDSNLVNELSEQVTEIADKLSTLVTENIHASCDLSSNADLLNVPSTSHGFLIPNAISQEPVILASLSHNNSAIFDEESNRNQFPNSIIDSTSQFLVAEASNNDVMTTSITMANENLSSLLNEDRNDIEITRVEFAVGYESDNHDDSQLDSGVGTENTSLDRSPDSELNSSKDKKSDKHYMNQNRVLDNTNEANKNAKNSLENSFTSDNVNSETVNADNEIVDDVIENVNTENTTVEINYKDNSNSVKNEAGPVSENSETWLNEANNSEASVSESVHVNSNSEDVNVNSDDVIVTREVVCENPSVRKRKKKKGPRIWSPGRVILENRSRNENREPMRLNLDHLMDGGSADLPPPELNICDLPFECASDEQIALALQAQEIAARDQARSKFRSSEDLIHRLFVCIAGVADQLQTNFASDLRNILKSVFLMNQTPEVPPTPEVKPEGLDAKIEFEPSDEQVIQNGSSFDSVYSAEEVYADSSDNSDSSNPVSTQSAPIDHQYVEESNENTVASNRESNNDSSVTQLFSDDDMTVTPVTGTTSYNPPSAQPSCIECQHRSSDDLQIIQRRKQSHRRNNSTHERPRPDMSLDSMSRTHMSHESRSRTLLSHDSRQGARSEVSASTGDLRDVNEPQRSYRSRATETTPAMEGHPPPWVPDMAAPDCMRCTAHFTAFRRRHHCRNCGKVFCAACSNASLPLPHFGQHKPVRVCLDCFQTLLTTRISGQNHH